MTTPTPMPPDEQHHLVGEATKTLLGQAPSGWERIIMDYMVVGRKVNVGAIARLQDGSTQRFPAPRELAPMLSALRQGMYTPDGGAWYSFRLIVQPPDRFTIQYNWNDQPPFPAPPAREQFALDQERFPRTPENMPEWFQRGLDGLDG
ncbi:hypothetical protein [Lentzea albida]|uniref:Uncharacterized protein n=1 Tax=Lentzea albida TaxID=65499 RepID=A0A1H9MGZ9_9PSEU|nr:hypothetical protein [Lentzea albida]SER22962.1 hypothetical protein SAMN04488000_10734 [Lentzea albida]